MVCRPLLVAALLSFWIAACFADTNTPIVHLLVPGFTVTGLPVQLNNQNNLRFAPDGSLTSLGYDGRVWRIFDSDGDGIEDKALPYWDRSTLSVPVGMAWTTKGLLVSSHGKVSLLADTIGSGQADNETVIASGWPATDVASGGVDATAVTVDPQGNIYFGLLVADYSNAYRLRKRKELRADEKVWLSAHGKSAEGDPDETVSLYDLDSKRGTIQKFDPRTKSLTTVATGIRVPYALAFNSSGDLFNTDQEGETWMPNGNPLDELNHIVVGRNYGFPPRHEKWLPNVVNTAPVVGFGPQHQSTCGMVFNEPQPRSATSASKSDIALPVSPGQKLFGPKWWKGDIFVAGESRGKLWRVHLTKTPSGYIGHETLIARFDMLVLDLAISPKGDLYVCCHSGKPDWGTGPNGPGKLFKISYTGKSEPQPVAAWAAKPDEVRITFDRPIDHSVTRISGRGLPQIEFGEYVRAAGRFESLKPGYAVVGQQEATPHGHLEIFGSRLDDRGRTLVLTTAAHPLPVTYAVTIPGVKAAGAGGPGSTVDLDYTLAAYNQASLNTTRKWTAESWSQLASWAPTNRASGGTDSRAPEYAAGDWEDGHGLFYGDKLQCAKCHRVRGQGAMVGPDLSNLVHRDAASVLRDIRDPGATLHPDYVTYQADLTSGETIQGFIRGTEPDTVRIVDAEGKETNLPRKDIRNLHPTGQSLMPSGLLDGLKDDQVKNLLTFLLYEPPVRERDEVAPILAAARPEKPEVINMVLIASKQDHGPGQHDYPAWQKNWYPLLGKLANVTVTDAWEWPSKEQFRSADVLVFYFWNHDWSTDRLAEIDAFQARGGGLVLIHAAVIADTNPEELAKRIGLAAQPSRVKYRHTIFDLHLTKSQSLNRGLPEWTRFLDEPYWPMIGDHTSVTTLATADVDGEPRPLIWTYQKGPGRVFASIPGHYAWTLADPFWRIICLRGIAWAAKKDDATLLPMTLDGAIVK